MPAETCSIRAMPLTRSDETFSGIRANDMRSSPREGPGTMSLSRSDPIVTDTDIRARFETALAAARDWHAADPVQRDFLPWPDDLAYAPRPANPVPGLRHLLSGPGDASEVSLTLRDAILAIAPFAEWRLTYTEDEVGRDFLDRFGWFELAGPEGHFRTLQTRMTIGFWGAGLHYAWHDHVPEELYTIVSGGGRFMAEGDCTLDLGPGGSRFHRSGQRHALTTLGMPILTFVYWRGDALADPPRMSAA